MELHSLLLVSLASLLLSLLLTPLARDLFLRLRILDRPDGGRKLHAHPVPRAGGIPIAFSYTAAYGILLALASPASAAALELPFIARLLPAASFIFVTGLIDDVFGLQPWQKLAGQLGAAALAIHAGVRIQGLAGHPLDTATSMLLTAAWLTACANAFNLIDGLDGLASGMGLFATLTTFIAAVLHGNETLALATLPLAGALLGFLRYNFSPASVFLGDSGSLFLGFLLGCYSVNWSQKSATLLGMTAPAMALAVPLLDTALSIVRRWLRGRPIFGADRHHIHHKLLERGLTQRGVVLLLYSAGCLCATLSLLQSFAVTNSGVILVLFCAITWLGIQRLGYFELGVAGRTLLGPALRHAVHGQIAMHALGQALARARSIEECWALLGRVAEEFGFSGVEARIHGRLLSHRVRSAPEVSCWELRVPLASSGYIVFLRALDAPPVHGLLMPIIETLVRQGGRLVSLPVTSEPTPVASLLGLAKGVAGHEPARSTQAVAIAVRAESGD